MKFHRFALCLVVLAGSGNAFVPHHHRPTASRATVPTTSLEGQANDWFGPAAVMAAGWAMAAQLSFATPSEPTTTMLPDSPETQEIVTTSSSSSMTLSAFGAPGKFGGQSFDTLDFSLPSYNEAVRGKSSSESTEAPAEAPRFVNPFASDSTDKEEAEEKAEEVLVKEDKKAAAQAAKEQARADKEAEKARKAEEKAAAEAKKAEKEARRQAELEKQRAAVERQKQAKKEDAEQTSEDSLPSFSMPDLKDIKAPEMPTFSMPDMPATPDLSKFEAPKFNMEMPKLDSKVDMPKVDMDMPKLEMPKVNIPSFGAPKLDNLPSFSMPDAPKFEAPKDMPKIDVPKVNMDMPKLSLPKVSIPSFGGTSVGGGSDNVAVDTSLDSQEVRDSRAKDARTTFLDYDKIAKDLEKQAKDARSDANDKKKIAKTLKDEACKTRPGGKFLCLRPFGSGY